MSEKNINEKILAVQSELKAPKGQTNSFGGYKYRSCEDILEAVKPLLLKNGLSMTISDEMVAVLDRVYVKATVTVKDVVSQALIEVSAYAREPLVKKGMDEAQITGATSSYARKYALNGTFNIDDTKDADTDAHTKQTKTLSKEELATRFQTCKNKFELENAYKKYKVDVDALPAPQAKAIKALVNECKLAHERGV